MAMNEINQRGADETHARGMTYGLLAWAWRYPSVETVSILCELLRRCLGPDAFGFHDPKTSAALESASSFLSQNFCDVPDLEATYSELFGHAVRGACPLYELEYGQAEIVQQAGELADIAGFYGAFGLESMPGSMERVDHVAVECEFMSVLCAKQASGMLTSDSEMVDICYDAERTFLREHLARWLPAICRRVAKSDSNGFYGRLALVGTAFVAAECQVFGITPGPEYVELRCTDPDADTEIQCGPAPAEQLVPLTVGGLR